MLLTTQELNVVSQSGFRKITFSVIACKKAVVITVASQQEGPSLIPDQGLPVWTLYIVLYEIQLYENIIIFMCNSSVCIMTLSSILAQYPSDTYIIPSTRHYSSDLCVRL